MESLPLPFPSRPRELGAPLEDRLLPALEPLNGLDNGLRLLLKIKVRRKMWMMGRRHSTKRTRLLVPRLGE